MENVISATENCRFSDYVIDESITYFSREIQFGHIRGIEFMKILQHENFTGYLKGETADSTAIESLRIPQNPSESLESLESLRIPQNPSESLESLRIS